MKTVTVELGDNSYPIHIGSGVLGQVDIIAPVIQTRQICIVSNEVIAALYLPKLQQTLLQCDESLTIEVVILPEGEPNKTHDSLNVIYDCLIEKKFSRDCLLIALGGGIVGDITGFAAASYQRGVDFIQIPTTLLAQVDSSVGGKTGVNHRLGKNLIGAFHQPKAVLIDIDVLTTLPKRELAAGMAEVIKYGLIRDEAFLQRLDEIVDDVMALNPDYLIEVIELSCRHKAQVVANDEKEKGERATLNLGHTFGHAVEALTNYQTYLHGEAVAIGTMMAAELSCAQGWLADEDVTLMARLFRRALCPTDLSGLVAPLSAEHIREAMQRDKKVTAGKLKLILLQRLGQAVIRDDMDEADICAAINRRMT